MVEFAGVDGALAADMRPASDALDVALISPYRAEVHDVLADTGASQRALLEGDKAAQARAVMPDVRWANHSDDAPALAGDHVVMVSLTSSRERLVPLPLTLTTNVVGQEDGVPAHEQTGATDDPPRAAPAAGDETTETTGPATDGPAQTPAPVAADESASTADDDASWLPWTLGAGGVLLAVAGGGLLLLRRT